MHSAPKKVTKRKINAVQEVVIESKMKKTDSIEKLKKAELISHIAEMVKKYDALEKKHKEKIDIIKSLEEKILRFNEKSNVKTTKETQTTQTETNLHLKCEECNFESENEQELDWHMRKHHGWPREHKAEEMDLDLDESQGVRYCVVCDYEAEDMYDLDGHTWSEHEDVEVVDHTRRKLERVKHDREHVEIVNKEQLLKVSCNFCSEQFETRKQLMEHKKNDHNEKVALCWNFLSGNCDYGDDYCWFIHNKGEKQKENFKCNICGHAFNTKNETQYHIKQEHVMSVPKCKNARKSCWYGPEKCWFQHDDIENTENEKSTNKEITSKLFDMMETFTQRIINIEKQMEMTSH